MYLDPQAVLDSARRHLPDQGGAPFVHVQLPGGASLRRFHRLVKDGGPSVIVMELGPEANKPEEVTSGDAPPFEIPFLNVQRYLAGGGIGVPSLLARDDEQGLLFVEDLGDQTLEAAVIDGSDSDRLRYYQAAIAELVRLQQYASQHPDPSCVAFGRSFDQKLLRWELEHFVEYGLDAQQIAISATERATLATIFDGLAGELAALPTLLVHRDYQSRNLMVQTTATGEIKIRVVDFQDALVGPYIYDLVGLLRDSYVVLSPTLLAELVDHFATLSGRPLEETRRHFALQTVQRKLKDAGRFVFIDRVKKNPSFLRHIPSSLRYVRDALTQLIASGRTDLAPIAALLDDKFNLRA